MRERLTEEHWLQVDQGFLRGPDGRRYSRRATRTKRKEAEQLVVGGAPLVLFYWGGEQLDWLDGADARGEWRIVRPHVTSEEPRRKGDVEWTAGRWEDEEGRPLVVLTGHC
ncbi:hypothetical protein [Blastococcus sp. SYSU D00695]